MTLFPRTSLLRLAMFLTVFSLDAAPMEREEEASFSLKPMEETLRHILSGTPAEKTAALSSALAITQNPTASLTDRDAAAHLVISYGSPEQQTTVMPLYLAKALDPAYPPGERRLCTPNHYPRNPRTTHSRGPLFPRTRAES